MEPTENNLDRIVVKADPDLQDLLPGYLDNRLQDIAAINHALLCADFELIQRLAHSMKGSGGGYGFDGITAIGAAMELCAKAQQAEGIKEQLQNLKQYLGKVEIVYD